tara:strand:+ start:45885 stop:45986 length:102 start_codon:yes stop_codon:yes gene_type:complete
MRYIRDPEPLRKEGPEAMAALAELMRSVNGGAA